MLLIRFAVLSCIVDFKFIVVTLLMTFSSFPLFDEADKETKDGTFKAITSDLFEVVVEFLKNSFVIKHLN